MGMSVKEFIAKKNDIIFKETDITLVPEDQIEECTKHKLSLGNAANACPYCLVYDGCLLCPMAKAKNECTVSSNNTWGQLVQWVRINTDMNIEEWYQSLPEMVCLYNEYNKQFKG